MIALLAVALTVGDSVAPFEPYWVTGEYKKTSMCPVCEYGGAPMVYVWTHGEGSPKLKAVVEAVSEETAKFPARTLFSFVVDANPEGKDAASQKKLVDWASEWSAPAVSLLSRSASLKTTLKSYKLEDSTKWKTVVYLVKGRKVKQTFLNPTQTDLPILRQAIAELP
jgi:hypothetical protein